MECLSPELTRAESIKEHSVGNRLTLELEAKLTDAALWPIELGILCCTLCSEEHSDTIVFSLLSISPWI